eukprot:9821364-Lingulodinium_polyedra.AAC.1
MDHKIPTRFKSKFISLYKGRIAELGRSTAEWPLQMAGRVCSFDLEVHGVYTLGPENAEGRILTILHCDGHEAH